jgi:inhibitor of cysteine peptidase
MFKNTDKMNAMMATVIFSLTGCGSTKSSKVSRGYNGGSFQLYENCEEMQGDVRSILKKKKMNDAAYVQSTEGNPDSYVPFESSSADAVASESSSGKDGFTNVQEKGVDEADHTKIGEHHIFVSNTKSIVVVDRKKLKELGNIDVSAISSVRLYVGDDRLVVMGSRQGEDCVNTLPSRQFNLMPTMSPQPEARCDETVVSIYETKQDEMPTELKTLNFKGRYYDSRFINNRLVALFELELNIAPSIRGQMHAQGGLADVTLPDEPVEMPKDDSDGRAKSMKCEEITKVASDDIDFRLTKVVAINTQDVNEESKSIGILGGGDNIYMSQEALYITKLGRRWYPWKAAANATLQDYYQPAKNDEAERLNVTKVAFNKDNGSIAVAAVGEVKGRTKDQWAFKEFRDHDALAIATSTGELFGDGKNPADNHLWVLKQDGRKLKVHGELHGFGKNEDIRAVRYVGSTAYVVTFKKTDPLYAIDLANLSKPKMLGELKVPGFSAYLHSISGDRLIGIGFDAQDNGDSALFQGLQISLFDVSRADALSQLDVEIIGKRGTYSEITADHHAFYFDEANELLGVPMVELNHDESKFAGPTSVKFSGAVFYHVNDRLKEVARISHDKFIPEVCKRQNRGTSWWENKMRSLDINRLFKVDGRLLSISRFGLKAHEIDEPSNEIESVQFEQSESDCSTAGLK